MHELVLSSQPAQTSAPRISPARGLLAGLRRGVAYALAVLTLRLEQLWALVRAGRASASGFFYLAYMFTSRRRKIERRAKAYLGQIPTATAAPDWIEAAVRQRWDEEPRPERLPRDLLDALVAREPATATSERQAHALGMEEVVGVVRDVLTAGVETTAETLSTAVMLVRAHPHAAARIREEARAAAQSASRGGGPDRDAAAAILSEGSSALPYACVRA